MLNFSKQDGLLPAVIQDATRHDVLMVGFMNQAAWEHTLATGYVTFYSRSRQKLWMKGETSGHKLRVVRLATDCDADALLIEVEMEGVPAVCHDGYRSCFYRQWQAPQFTPVGSPVFDPATVYNQK